MLFRRFKDVNEGIDVSGFMIGNLQIITNAYDNHDNKITVWPWIIKAI